MLKKIAGIFLIFFCGVASLGFYFYTPLIKNSDVIYFLKPGTSKSNFSAALHQQGLLKHPLLFSLFLELSPQPIKTGEYCFKQGASLISIWQQVTQGKGLFYRAFTIIPGWTFEQVRTALANAIGIKSTIKTLTSDQIMAKLGVSVPAEGRFFPETYFYTRGISDIIILKVAVTLMEKKLQQAWRSRLNGLAYQNKDQALIAASLIEKEAYLNAERPIIASVLINRLNKKMRLQFDPTVIYGLGNKYQGKIMKADLLQDTAYNTYTRFGLPPTPIAIPSFSSIQAALQPNTTDYLYFVAKGDGSHQFSKTLTEHLRAVVQAKANKH